MYQRVFRKISFTKVGRENLRIFELEIDDLVGGEIFLWRIVGVYNRSILGYLEVFLKPGKKQVGSCVKFHHKYIWLWPSFWS